MPTSRIRPTHLPCSARTKAALQAAKARGQKLGGFRGRAGTADDAARARAARSEKARDHAAALAPILTRLDPDGSASLRSLAAALTAEGVPTATGRGGWTATGVARLRATVTEECELAARREAAWKGIFA